MKFTYKPSPNVRHSQSTQSIMRDLTIGLLVVYAFALFYYFTNESFGITYGIRAITLMILAVVTSLIVEILWNLVRKKPILDIFSSSFPVVTAMIFVLTLPINTSYYAVIISTIIAIFFGKLLFGGFGQNIFNPAAVGRAIILSSFSGSIAVDVITGATPIQTIHSMGWIVKDSSAVETLLNQFGGLGNLFVGFYPGAIGETSTLVILLVGIFLVVRKVIDWRIPVTYIATVFGLTLVVGMVNGVGIWYPLYHILTGGVMFAAVFMLTDPVTKPTSAAGRVIFAIGAAFFTVLIRLKSNLPEGVVFSILIMNMLTPMIEGFTDGQQLRSLKKYRLLVAGLVIVAFAIITFTGTTLVAKEPVEEEKPTVSLGTSFAIEDESILRYQGEILKETTEGNLTTYHVLVDGYGMVDDDGSHGITYTPNEFEIVVNTEEKKIVSIKYLHFGDTKNIGDKTMNEEYYKVFADLSTEDYSQQIDTVSGATYTSKSMISAIRIVMDTLGQ